MANVMRFYRLHLDSEMRGTWFLGEPTDEHGRTVNPELFTSGKLVPGSFQLQIPIEVAGRPLDFHFAAFLMMVARTELLDELESAFRIPMQRLPVRVKGDVGRFEILNLLDVVECVDLSQSVFKRFDERDRADRLGEIKYFEKLIVDSRAQGHHFFRIKEWGVGVIISEDVKNFFERRAVSGVSFDLVS